MRQENLVNFRAPLHPRAMRAKIVKGMIQELKTRLANVEKLPDSDLLIARFKVEISRVEI